MTAEGGATIKTARSKPLHGPPQEGPESASKLPFHCERELGLSPILIDSGYRRGTDIVKALALGANAVLLGRASLYAL